MADGEVDRKAIEEQIKQQGDVVRALKAEGAAKEKVQHFFPGLFYYYYN